MRDVDLHDLTMLRERSDRADFCIQKAICSAIARGNHGQTRALLADRFGARSPHLVWLDKASVAAHTTTDSGLADERLYSAAVLGLVARRYAFEAIPFIPVPPNVFVGIEQQGAVGTRVHEGRAIAVGAGDLTTARVRVGKLATIRVMTRELAQQPDAAPTIERMMTRDIGTTVDTAAFDPTDALSLTFSAPTIPPTGNDADDIADLLAAISDGVPSRPWLVLGASVARRLFFSGEPAFVNVKLVGLGEIGGVPTVASPATALTEYAIALDADAIAKADLGLTIDSADAAALQMDNSPTNATADGSSPAAPVATNVVSLWQTDSIGLRAIRYVGWAKRATAVAVRDYSGSPA